MINIVLGMLIVLSSPLFLLPIEKILPFPYFIEEAVKLTVVLMIIKTEKQLKENLWIWIFIAGFLFTFSESAFYSVNIFVAGDMVLFLERLGLTGMLHIGTIVLMYFLSRSEKRYSVLMMIAGFLAATLIHYLFNLHIAAW